MKSLWIICETFDVAVQRTSFRCFWSVRFDHGRFSLVLRDSHSTSGAEARDMMTEAQTVRAAAAVLRTLQFAAGS